MQKVHFLITIALLIGLIILSFFFFRTKQEIVYVDTLKLIREYQEMKDAQAEFEIKSKSWQSNVDTLAKELEESIKKFEKERTSLSGKEIQLSQELLRTKQNQYLQYKEAIQQKSAEEEQKLQQQVLNQVNIHIKEYGKKHGYKIIMGATAMGNIVYADEVTDITDDILKGLNANYKK